MWKKPEKPVPLDPEQLVEGLFIWLDVSWDEHPFLYNRFKINDAKQLTLLREMPGIKGKLYYFPEKSTVPPGSTPLQSKNVSAQPKEAIPRQSELDEEILRQRQEKQQRLQSQKDAAARADRAWEKAARVTREAMLGMNHSPRQAGIQMLELSRQTASLIARGQEILLHLLGDKEGEGPQYHALNVMTLSMLLGKSAGLTEDQLGELALAAIAHDIGKSRIPLHILKTKKRARHEEDFYRQHPFYGVEMAKASGVFPPQSIIAIAGHHQYLDGSGWPNEKRNMGVITRIIALANRYDRLCSPESPQLEALMPAEALARIFRSEAERFDKQLLSMLIKLLGVYPPGTLVKLNDESLALVVSPGKNSLRPTVLIYSPEFSKRDAPTVDLAAAEYLNIDEAIRPSSVPPDVLDWISPRQRLSYFFSTEHDQ